MNVCLSPKHFNIQTVVFLFSLIYSCYQLLFLGELMWDDIIVKISCSVKSTFPVISRVCASEMRENICDKCAMEPDHKISPCNLSPALQIRKPISLISVRPGLVWFSWLILLASKLVSRLWAVFKDEAYLVASLFPTDSAPSCCWSTNRSKMQTTEMPF